MTHRRRLSARLVIFGLLAALAIAYVGAWLYFHTLPWASEFKESLRQARYVEIFSLEDGVPKRWARFDDPQRWADLARLIRYQGTFWRFSDGPVHAIVIQTIVGDEIRARHMAWEVRGDGCLHHRKAARWYCMPVEPAFEERVRQMLARDGRDLTPEDLERLGFRGSADVP